MLCNIPRASNGSFSSKILHPINTLILSFDALCPEVVHFPVDECSTGYDLVVQGSLIHIEDIPFPCNLQLVRGICAETHQPDALRHLQLLRRSMAIFNQYRII